MFLHTDAYKYRERPNARTRARTRAHTHTHACTRICVVPSGAGAGGSYMLRVAVFEMIRRLDPNALGAVAPGALHRGLTAVGARIAPRDLAGACEPYDARRRPRLRPPHVAFFRLRLCLRLCLCPFFLFLFSTSTQTLKRSLRRDLAPHLRRDLAPHPRRDALAAGSRARTRRSTTARCASVPNLSRRSCAAQIAVNGRYNGRWPRPL
jgi:hypothetical protein